MKLKMSSIREWIEKKKRREEKGRRMERRKGEGWRGERERKKPEVEGKGEMITK